jgi:hypothetical protein
MTPHLTPDELIRWRDQAPAADRDRVVSHLAECDACGSAYAKILDVAPVDTPARPDARDFAVRGIASGPARRRGWPRPVLALAASIAAVALAAVLLPGARRAIMGEAAPDGDGVRATSVLLVTPVGEVRDPLEFAWRSPVHAARYRVDLKDAAGNGIGTLIATEERAALPAGLRALLRPGSQYDWTVTALDERGETLLTSDPATFRMAASTDPSR